MTPLQSNPDRPTTPVPFRWTRTDATEALHDFQQPGSPYASQRDFQRQTGTPRSTLQHWLSRHNHPDLDPAVVAFFDSPVGHDFLRVLLLALHLVFHLAGPAGIRPLSRFLQLTRLDRFVAASFGSQQALAVDLQQLLCDYADAQRQCLAPIMPEKKISACLDENFHGSQPCLVAIEPVSNFLLLEAYHPQRDGDTWTKAMQQATADLAVEIVQITSDSAKGLLACARVGLEAQHSSDLFHGQRDLSRAVAGPLARQTKAAETKHQQAVENAAARRQQQQVHEHGPPRPGRPPDFATHIRMADSFVHHAAAHLQQCQTRQEQAHAAVRGVGDDYHPFDAATGRPQTAATIEKHLERRLQVVEEVADKAQLGQATKEGIGKVRRWLPSLVVSVVWYWQMVAELLVELKLSAQQERAVREQLLPGLYWQREALRGRDAEQNEARRELSQRLLAATEAAASPLAELAKERRVVVQRVAQAAVELFVRSSSCVEGRNGHLSLYHHGQGPLSASRLQSLTAVHNYVMEDTEGRTAAERFFGVKPEPVFAWLLERMPELPRPARRRADDTRKAAAPAA